MVSLFAHGLSLWTLSASKKRWSRKVDRPKTIKVNMVNLPKKKEPKAPEQEKTLPVLETPLEKTAPPKKARAFGQQDHQTQRETRVDSSFYQAPGQDPGHGGKDSVTKKASRSVKQPPPPSENVEPGFATKKKRQPRNAYEALMPSGTDLSQQVKAGYLDYVDESVEIGERIDINTSDYRYIGYFTSLRKAFELVWTYPIEAARRGLHGQVGVEFIIAKDGSLRKAQVVKSSGHRSLDNAVIEAIKLAAPYSPLPEGLQKNKLVVVGSFRYILNNFGVNVIR